MATYKRIDGDYFITTLNSSDNVQVQTNTLKVLGNLDVQGNVTYISSTELDITDPFITLAANNNGSYANIGLIAQKSSDPNLFAGLRFNVTSGTWQISNDNITFVDIGVGNGLPGGANTYVQFNDGGAFNGNANLVYDKTISKLTLTGHQVFGNIGTAPSSVANSLAVYHNAIGSGGTGLYVKNSAVQDELVSKSKAIVFGIIF